MFTSWLINYKVNFGSPANTEKGMGEGGGQFNLQAIKNSVLIMKNQNHENGYLLDKIYSFSSSNN